MVGHRQDTVLPAVTSFFDWEAEIGVVVGAPLAEATPAEAGAAIAGYTIADDGTARDLQPIDFGGREIVDWFSAKSLDRSSALGPAVFPAGAVPDPDDLRITLRRNGDTMQDDRAGSMLHRPEQLLARISRILELQPGDVLLTGTPAGVGKARGVSLADGDELEITVAPLGTLRTRIAARPARRGG
jgi:2-keto-4-pentenoate hydratase/2-oxohepta-3-ene-1,7-dioic acid hydratase in catechol pathway